MQLWAMNILFYCSNTPTCFACAYTYHQEYKNCSYSHKYGVYTVKMGVVEGKTVKNNLEPAAAKCQRGTMALGTRMCVVRTAHNTHATPRPAATAPHKI
jgi:hypothetical protein